MREIRVRAWDKDTKKWLWYDDIPCGPLDCTGDQPFMSIGTWNNIELCLFTGLLDSNGKKIWEGDVIVLPGYNQNSEVLFRQGMFCAEEDGSFFPLSQFYSTVEVIGNIYENPELLEKKP